MRPTVSIKATLQFSFPSGLYRILFAVRLFYYLLQNSINPVCWYRTTILGKICIFFLIFNRYRFVS